MAANFNVIAADFSVSTVEVAVIVVEPFFFLNVTSPVSLTVATSVSEEVHVTVLAVSSFFVSTVAFNCNLLSILATVVTPVSDVTVTFDTVLFFGLRTLISAAFRNAPPPKTDVTVNLIFFTLSCASRNINSFSNL